MVSLTPCRSEKIQFSRSYFFLSSSIISAHISLFYNMLSTRVLYHPMNEADIDLQYLCLHLIYLCFHFNNCRLLKMFDITKREFAELTLDGSCKTRENSHFLKNGKTVISVKIQNFSNLR